MRRWPNIIDNAFNDFKTAMEKNDNADARREGKEILESITTLKNEIAGDKPLRYRQR